MDIKVYTTEGCFYCEQLKKLFSRAGIDNYTELGRTELTEDYPDISGFPFVVIDGNPVGGLVPVAKLFLEKGLVTSKKNGKT